MIWYTALTTIAMLALSGPARAESVDIGPIISASVQIVGPIIAALGLMIVNRYVRNEQMRRALTGALEYGAQYGLTRVAGAVRDRPVTVEVAIPVLAHGLSYVLRYTPDAVKWFQDRDHDIVRKLAARLPGIDGALDDATIARVITMARSGPPL